MASTLIDISEKPVPTTALSAPQNDKSPDKNVTEAPAPVKQAPKTAAIYLPEKIIRNPNSLNAFLENAKKIGATAVVIDFKRDDGTLAYQSESANAKKINSVQNAADLKQIIKTIQDSGIKVTARIHCFRDPLAASRLGASAYVHYKDTASAWIDNAPDKGGKRWLNPFSEESQNYLLEIIAEVSAMNVDEIILQSVQFPSGYGLSSATYPGESESGKTKNQILKIFISKASRSAGAVPLAVEVTADGTLNGSDSLYGGSLIDSKDAVFSRISGFPHFLTA